MVKEQKDKVIQIRLDNETFDKLAIITKKKAINRSEKIRQWIDKYIEDNKELLESPKKEVVILKEMYHKEDKK